MRTILIAAAAVFALDACSDNDGENEANRASTNQASAPAPLDQTQQQVIALPDAPRNAVLIRAIRDAGQECQNVESSTRQPDAGDGSPVWLAQCTDDRLYVVAVGRGGNANVAPARAVGGSQ